MTKMEGSTGSRPDTATSQRPGTAGSQQRPGTAGSRPGTAQKMAEAGVRDPLMLSKPKLSEKRFANAEQVDTWERQTLTSLTAVQKQIDKTCHHMDHDMENMTKYLRKADDIIQRGKELNANMNTTTMDNGEPMIPSLISATISKANADLAAEFAENQNTESRRDSRVMFRLQHAVEHGRQEGNDKDDEYKDPPKPHVSSPAAVTTPFYAAFDEEIEEEEPPDDHVVPSPEPEPQEIEEEALQASESEAPEQALGPRASRALAAVSAKAVASANPGNRSRGNTPEFRVEARAKDRSGGQPSQGSRVRPPAAPTRNTTSGPTRR